VRTIAIGFILMVLAMAAAAQPGKPSPAIPVMHKAAVRAPVVFWKRGMPAVPKRTMPESAATAQVLPVADPAAPVNEARVMSPAVPEPAAARLSREQMLAAIRTINKGARRASVIASLGPPAYSIDMPEGEHMVERCRFRAGSENVGIIEFRDGVVETVDRAGQ
jgi:hypothetical protein